MRVSTFLLVSLLSISNVTGKGEKGADNRRLRRSLKKEKSQKGDRSSGSPDADDDDLQEFESGFFISYTGLEERFDVANTDAVEFLQDSIRDVYNQEIGADTDVFVNEVILFNQTLATIQTGRRLQFGGFGLTFSVVSFYTVKGDCRSCGRTPRMVNDAARRKLGRVLRKRSLQESGVDRFNSKIVDTLTTREEFQTIETASLSNEEPPPGLEYSEDYIETLDEITVRANDSRDVISNDQP